ncbi:MAG: tetratricopeptide repeat protein [Ottowia sp.]|uniref:bacteriophage N4 adsorption protein A n=1 Tax=Ottowia sp. TaxID=1898956 RepID=UPI003C7733D3
MKFIYQPFVLAMALASFGALAQTVDLGPGLSPMQRFQLYPRIDKALEAMARGDGPRAITELQAAQRVAPENTAIALYLADAYRRFGQPARAEEVLKAQLRRTPGEPRLGAALRDLQGATIASAPAVPPAAPPMAPASPLAAAPGPSPASESPSEAAQRKPGERPRVSAATPRVAARPSRAPTKTAKAAEPAKTEEAAPATPARSGYEPARQAYAAMARGDAAAALPWARQAAQAEPEYPDYQRLLVYLLIENGHLDEAESYATAAESRVVSLQSDPVWQAQREQARQRAAYKNLEVASEAAQQAYQAYSARDYDLAARKAEEAAQRNVAHLPYLLLRLQALAAGGHVDQALQEAEQILQKRTDASEVLALRSRLRHDLGQDEAAATDARAALQAGGLSLPSEVDLWLQLGEREKAASVFAAAIEAPGLQGSADPDLAYLATRVGDDRTALAVFNRARAKGSLPASSWRDGAYTASRLAENGQAVEYFQDAIDAAERHEIKLTPQELFSTRREVADRTRAWGANALLGYRGISPGSVSAQPGLYGDVAQVVGEAFWRPRKFGDGRFWELYGGLAQTVYSRQDGPTGGATTQGALGIRAKPFSNHNFVLSAERRIRIGSLSINDWLLRAGYSGGTGTDLRVDVPNWTTLNVYAEAGRFLQRRQNYATFEAQAGRSFRVSDADSRLVLFPHAVLGVDYNSQRTSAGYNGAAGAGLGIGVRYWFREDRYNAPRSYLDLSLQYRARLLGDERGKGVFLRASLVY